MSILSPQLALRIGLAARALPSVSTACLVQVLIQALKYPLTDQKLKGLTLQQLRAADRANLKSVPVAELESALRYLTDRATVDILDPDTPSPAHYQAGDMPGSVRVAIASNHGQALDGNFSDCIRFLIFQVSPDSAQLVDVRGTAGDRSAKDRNAWRAHLIRDCGIVFVAGIGIRGHSHLIQHGTYLVRNPQSGAAIHALESLQQVLRQGPPPWLAKLIDTLDIPVVIAPVLPSQSTTARYGSQARAA